MPTTDCRPGNAEGHSRFNEEAGEASEAFPQKISQFIEAYQPTDIIFPPKQTKTQNVYFQQKWYKKHPWIHYDKNLKKILYFICAKADNLGLLTFCQNKEPAFITDGFDNWKKGKEKLKKHESTDTHRFAVYQMSTRHNVPLQHNSLPPKRTTSLRSTMLNENIYNREILAPSRASFSRS